MRSHAPARLISMGRVVVPLWVRFGLMSRLDRITSDPSICHGKPTVRGLRYPVENLLELLASGMTVDEIPRTIPTWSVTMCSPRSSSAR